MATAVAIFLVGLIFTALTLSVCTFVFKYMIFGFASGFLWISLGILFVVFPHPDEMQILFMPLYFICFMFGIAMFFSPLILRQRPLPDVPEEKLRPTQRLKIKLDRYNEAREPFKKK